ncbi:MAG: ketopantoate reductase family protein [Chloroflexota bacterium]
MKTKRIGFIGAGAIAAYIGAFLSREGHEVTLIDGWPEQIDMLKRQGIEVTGPHDPFNARPRALHICEAHDLHDGKEFDIGFVAMKAYDTKWSAAFIDRFVTPEGYVVASQNCWTDEMVASVVGRDRTVGLIMSSISVGVWEPGKVDRGAERGSAHGHDVFRAGELDGTVTPRTRELADMLSVIDGAHATDNLWGERWTKLSQNAMGNPVQAMTGQGSIEVASTPRGRQLSIMLAHESVKVGLALGHSLGEVRGEHPEKWAAADRGDVYEELDGRLTPSRAAGRNWKVSMAQDVAKGRRTEIEYMNGFIAKKGREVGVPTPVSEAVTEVVRAIDEKQLEASPDNIELTLRKAGL